MTKDGVSLNRIRLMKRMLRSKDLKVVVFKKIGNRIQTEQWKSFASKVQKLQKIWILFIL